MSATLRCGVWAVLTGATCPACFYNPTIGEPDPGTSTSTSSGPVTATDSGSTTGSTEATGAATTEAPTSPTSATGPTDSSDATTLPPPECTVDDDCGESDAPSCVDERCVACDQAADPAASCASKDPSAPVCVSGICVECSGDDKALCQDTTPVCSAGNVCTACTEHSDCEDTACDLETGACLRAEYIIHVDRAAACDAGDGSMAAPYCTIGHAFQKMLGNDVMAGWTLKIKSGNYVEEPLVVPDGSRVAMISWDGIAPKIRATPGSSTTLSALNETRLYIDNLAFNLNDEASGVACTAAKVWIDDSRMASNVDQGYVSVDCDTWIRRSVIFKNGGGGIASYGVGGTWITNSFVTSNGTQVLEDYGGIRSAQGNEMHVNFSTVVNNLTASGPRSIQCTPDAGAAEIRNSVLIAFGGTSSINCATGIFSNCALDEIQPGDTNIVATVMDIMTFFNPQANGVYGAKPDTALTTLGVWTTGDPGTDFDGTARANMDGAPEFAGADRP